MAETTDGVSTTETGWGGGDPDGASAPLLLTKHAVRLMAGNPVFPLLAALLILFALFVPYFATIQNVQNLALESIALLLLAGGGAVVLISGNFDLSSEGTLAFTAVLGAWLMQKGSPGGPFGLSALIVIPLMIVLGIGIGLVNAVLVTKFKVNPFIVTLTMLLTLKGAAAIPGGGQTFFELPSIYTWPADHSILGVSLVVIIGVLLFIALALYLRYSVYGRHVYAVGGNMQAAIESGVAAGRVITIAYAGSGALAAIAGWLEASRVGSAQALLDDGIIFNVFAAMIIGGIALAGGRGNLFGVAGGVLVMTTINNVLNLSSLNPLWVDFMRGVILFLGIAIIIVRQSLGDRLGVQERAW